MPAGRESTFTQEIGDTICARLADGESLRRICQDEDMPDKSTVMRWLAQDENLRDQYARAREAQADRLAEEILEIADDGRNDTYTDEDGNERTNQEVVARSRLRVDARKWLASKMAPKKYGDKVELSGTGEGGALLIGISTDPKVEQ
ncbi:MULTISPECIES: terminase small subunit protein [unclassified Achromobacter]|uniref:terminase small subunit-like protein n=1 Tax=unclassified Achromobacter TaxID=2626865 RepID=UPI000B519356|nr:MULTISPECIES: terminase small subunit protein [unclassified Achromobacter]OWT68078.1 terminase small subunit protein [Achromobacter sp. HZ34]OWT69915.1 terminase small subunit protein [Achromobacter sp. HZ28]